MAGLQPPSSQDKEGYQQEIGKERWDMIDGDVLFIITVGEKAQKALAKFQNDPLWSRLDVIQRDRAHPVSGYWVGSGVLAAQEVINDLEEYLPH